MNMRPGKFTFLRIINFFIIITFLIYALNVTGVKTASAAVPDFWVFIGFNDCTHGEIQGYHWPAGATVHLTIDDPATLVSPDYTADVLVFDEEGHGIFGLNELPLFTFQPGLIVRMWDDVTDISHTITALCAAQVDVLNDRVIGTAEPGSVVHVNVESEYREETADSSGNWTADFSVADTEGETVFDILPEMHVMGSQSNGGGTTGFSWHVNDPWFYVFLSRGDGLMRDIHGYDWPLGVPVTMTLDNPSTPEYPDYTRTAYMEDPPWGGDKQLVFDITGIYAYPGDVVTMSDGITANLTHTIPALRVYSVNAITNTVIGTAAPGSVVNVSTNSVYRNETAAADGSWVAHFSIPGDEPGEAVGDIARDSIVHSSQSNGGGTTDLPWYIPNPFFDVWLNPDGTLQAFPTYGWPEGEPVTLKLYHNNLLSYSDIAYPDGNGYAAFNTTGASIAPGDVVTVTDGVNAILTHTVTWLTVSDVDATDDIVTGNAIPGSLVSVRIENNPVFRNVTALENGTWFADFSEVGDEQDEDIIDLVPGMVLQISQSNGDGITAYRWEIIQYVGTITGTVRDLEGDPITGVSIDVNAYYGGNNLSVCTNPVNGVYHFENLPIDLELTITANSSPGTCEMNNYGWESWEHKTTQDATPIILTSAEPDISGIDFTLGTVYPYLETFWFNLNRPFMSELPVRQAIAYGTDRQRMLDEVWKPMGFFGTVQNAYTPDSYWAHASDSSVTLYPFNVTLANSILADAGWIDIDADGIREKGGQELVLSFKTNSMQPRVNASDIFVENMLALGIKLNVEFAPFYPMSTDFDIMEFVRVSCGSLEDTSCVPLRIFVTDDPENIMGYNNPTADALFVTAQTTTDLEELRDLAIQHQALVSQDLPVLPLFTRVNGYWISGKVGVAETTISYNYASETLTTNSDSSGNYQFSVPFDWTGTITPSKPGWIFTPSSININFPVSSDLTGVNFTATNKPGKFNKTSPANSATNQPKNLQLAWDASVNADEYQYCLDTTSGTTCTTSWITTGTNTNVNLTALTPATYYWQVRARNSFGYTYANFNTWWSFTVPPLPAAFSKTAPLNAATSQPANPQLTWNASVNAVSYEYCIDKTNDNACSTGWKTTGINKTVTLSGLMPAAYYWQVRARNATGIKYANNGTWWSFTVPPKPGAFSKTSPANNSINRPVNLSIKWASSVNALKYEYCFDTTNDNKCTTWKSTNLNTFAYLKGLLRGKKYYWMVRAVNGSGTTLANGGVWWNFTTAP